MPDQSNIRQLPPPSEPPSEEEQSPEGSEDALALEFASNYSHLFRHTPGMGWMRCRAHYWRRDDELSAFDCARQVARVSAYVADKPALARAIASSKTVNGIISLAKSDLRITLPAAHWDADGSELNTPGGIVELRTGRVRRRDETDYLTQCTRVEPAQAGGASCPTWERFLDQVFDGDRDMVRFMQRLIGYSLTGDRREQKVFFMYGLGANGKSTLWDFIAWLAGTYSLKLPAQVLMQSHLQGHPTELAQLRGKRLAISSEIEEGQYWAESRIKELTGDEMLTARFMRQDFFEFLMAQKHVIVGNYKPRMKGGDAALARRFVLVPFLARFAGAKRDPQMLDKLRSEAPAVMAWAIQGAVKWYAEGLAIPAAVVAASSEYMVENDDLQIWLDECCVLLPGISCKATPLYGSYLGWLKARGQHAPSMRLWADRMVVVPTISKHKSHGVMVYVGVGLKEHAQAES